MPLTYVHLMADAPDEALRFLETQRERLGAGFSTFHYLSIHRQADTLTYQGRAVEAFEYVSQVWQQIVTSHLCRGRMMRAVSYCMRARAAVSAYHATRNPKYSAIALADCRKLASLQCGYQGFVSALRASVCLANGDRAQATALMERAIEEFDRDRVTRFAICARRRLGEILGDARGAALIEAADRELNSQGVRNPERWISVHLGPTARSDRALPE